MKLAWALVAWLAAGPASASPAIALGAAAQYSGFFFGNVGAAADVEGRLAVGGNLTSGFDIGYRVPYGSSSQVLVVGGNLTWQSGELYAGPSYATDTNASIGPAAAQWLTQFDPSTGRYKVNPGTGVYGGTANFGSYWNTGAFSQQSGALDFNAAYSQLSGLSGTLGALADTGSVAGNGSGGLLLTGDGLSTLQVFNLGNLNPANISLANVPAGAHIVINSSRSDVVFSGFVGSQTAQVNDLTDLGAFRDRLIFNLPQASSVEMNTGVNGVVLAVDAAVQGSGHLEGSLIAQSLSRRASDWGTLELGYESFVDYAGTPAPAPVPEPATHALLGAGLAVLAWRQRQRRAP